MPNTLIHVQDSSGIDRPVRGTSAGQIELGSVAGADSTFDVQTVLQKCQSATVTADGTVKATPGFLLGVFIIATSSGTFVLRDGGSSGTIKLGEASNAVPTAAGTLLNFGCAIEFSTDIYFDLVSGSMAANIFYV